jgi:hypothetical protein
LIKNFSIWKSFFIIRCLFIDAKNKTGGDITMHFNLFAKGRSGRNLILALMTVALLVGCLIFGGTATAFAANTVTVTGDGVSSPKTFTETELKAMSDDVLYKYSRVNSQLSNSFVVVKGVKLSSLLEQTGIKGSAKMITIRGNDGYGFTFTRSELLSDERYYYPNLSSNSVTGAQKRDVMISLSHGEGNSASDLINGDMRLCVGQRYLTEQNDPWTVKYMNGGTITVSNDSPATWSVPTADVTPGNVSVGKKVVLSCQDNNNAKIYYTTDGSTPNLESEIYNKVAPKWTEPAAKKNLPIVIDKNTTIKAMVVGPGKVNSPVAEFKYTVDGPEIIVATDKFSLDLDAMLSGNVAQGTLQLTDINALVTAAHGGWVNSNGKQKVLGIKLKTQETATSAELTIPADCLQTMLASQAEKFQFDTQFASIVLDKNTLQKITKNNNGDLVFIAGKEANKTVSVLLKMDTKTISSLPEMVKVKIPHTLTTGESTNLLTVFGVYNNKTAKISQYNYADLTMDIITTGLGDFTVSSDLKTFTDVGNKWFTPYISFLASRDVVNGTGKGLFEPNKSVTRAEFVKMLVGAVDWIDIEKAPAASFKDIKQDAWYSQYVNWAVEQKVVNGYSKDSFVPHRNISRQEMATMSLRFANTVGINLGELNKTIDFKDNNQIQGYAKDAVKTMQQAGIINGKGNSLFDPKGNATRGETAKIVKLIMEWALI